MSRRPTTYICTGYIGLSKTGSGVLYPIYKTSGLNASFVQEVAQDGTISAFLPFYEHENFLSYSTELELQRVVGQDSIYSFLDGPDMVEVTYKQVGELVNAVGWIDASARLPILTRLTLARIGKSSQSKQVELLGKFLKERVKSNSISAVVIAAHNRFHYNLERYWADDEADDGAVSGNLPNEFLNYGTEELFEWLFEHECNARWTFALRVLIRRIVYDERLFELIGRLVTMEGFDLSQASRLEKVIVARGLEIYKLLQSYSGDFAEAMYDYVLNGEIFSLAEVVEPKTILEFIDHLENENKLDFLAIDTYIDILRSDTITRDIAYALIDKISESQDLSARYTEKSAFPGWTRLDVFKDVVDRYGRLGLVVDAARRREVSRLFLAAK